MYRAFYSLSGEPFSKEIAPGDYFPSRNWSEAKARLQYLVRARGIGVLVGEPGSGKTFALRSLAAGLNPALYRVIYLPLSTGTVMDFYRGLAGGLGEEPKFRKIDLFEQIQHSVLNLFQERKITPVFILDEMHLASPKFLLDLSLLFNFSMDSLNPFVFVLSGLPFLLNRLGLSQTQSLTQRVVMRYKMEPLERDEVKGYIEHHLKLAGANHPLFTDSAVEAIASNSRGWPRMVNNLAGTALMLGAQLKVCPVDEDIVRQAAGELGF